MPSVTVSIEHSLISRSPRAVACPGCREALDLYQPDPDSPDRLLGTCDGCKAWYVLDRERGVMALLPVELALRGARAGV